jgi:hypothetical protein
MADAEQIKRVAYETGKTTNTIRRWAKQGCDLNNPASINVFLQGNKLRQNPNTIRKPKKDNPPPAGVPAIEPEPEPDLNTIELGPIGKRGAAAALARLEEIEERASARLMRAIEHGNAFQVKAAQEFYLRSSETLRRLDLAVETERRNAEEQVPKKQAEAISLHIAEWLRIAFAQFLSSESRSLMGIKDLGEFKLYAVERFKGILHMAVKTSLQTNSPIPPWAAAQVIEAWNVPTNL